MIASGNERGWAAVFLSNLWFTANLVAWLYSGQEERLWRKWRILSRDRCYFSSVQFSCSVVSDSLPSHESQHSKLPCPQLPEFTQTHIHWVSDAIQPSHPPLSPSPPASNPSQHQGLFHESTLCMRWPKYWSFSFSISPSNEHSGLISFRMDWLYLLAVQGTLKSLLQHHSSKASILRCSAFFTVQLSHPYMTDVRCYLYNSKY